MHDVAALIKEYLRMLPEPILTCHLEASFLQASSVGEDAVLPLCLLLPIPNLNTLKCLANILYKVHTHSDLNKMSAHNLALVLTPAIFSQNFSDNTVVKDNQPRLMNPNHPVRNALLKPNSGLSLLPSKMNGPYDFKKDDSTKSSLNKRKPDRESDFRKEEGELEKRAKIIEILILNAHKIGLFQEDANNNNVWGVKAPIFQYKDNSSTFVGKTRPMSSCLENNSRHDSIPFSIDPPAKKARRSDVNSLVGLTSPRSSQMKHKRRSFQGTSRLSFLINC